MITANETVFELLEDLRIPLVDRMVLATIEAEQGLIFGYEKLYSNPISDFSYFTRKPNSYCTIQNGEILTLNHVDRNKPFIAYQKEANLSLEHELVRYSPVPQEG